MKKPSAAELIKLSGLDDLSSLAIIGLSKNAGKTTSLNHLIRAWTEEGMERPLALTSVGRDGEAEDIVSGICKPRIYLPKGHLLATSVASLRRCDGLVDIRELSGIRSAFGEIVIGKMLSDGYVELAGPSQASELKLCEGLLREEEADCLYIVDGALSRRSPAGGGVTEGVILAVSYGKSASPSELKENLRHAVKLLTLPGADDGDRDLIRSAISKEEGLRALALDEKSGELRILTAESLLGEADRIRDFYRTGDRLLFLRGAITEALPAELLKLPHLQQLQLVVEDGSRLFIERNTVKRLEAAGVELKVLYPLSLRLITFNPRLEDGSPVDNPGIVDDLRRAVSIPLFDLGPASA
ncbi:MAG: hypothetical protein GX763_00240 [Clostridiaceae bacterium]|nr:hypothetical protein [Clostridiaceae bacterium]